jgi:glycosyltransferase involved in cell wall biosynthesis
MRVLQCDLASSFPLARAGGHRTVHSLLLQLARARDVECMTLFPRRGLGSMLPDYDPTLAEFESLGIRGLSVTPGRWIFDCGYPAWAVERVEDELDSCLAAFQPDVVWSNSLLSMPVLRAARRRGLAALWYVHDCRPAPQDLREAARIGVHIAAVSNFIRDRILRVSGHRADVVYPLTIEDDYLAGSSSADFVTFINPRPVKGYDVVLRLIPLLPDVQFLVVEAWPLGAERETVEAQLALFPNVRFVRRLADTREIYARTRILLVPSVVEEGGPRVIREAQLNRIPVLGSARGGVPEMVGDGGLIIEDYEDAGAWAAAVRMLVDDAQAYRRLSDAALKNAYRDDLTTPTIVRRFTAALRRAADMAAAGAMAAPQDA